MKPLLALPLPLLLLAACKAQAPTPPAASTVAEPVRAEGATGPGFDCAKATSEVEKLLCRDAALAALDRELAAQYQKVLAATRGEERERLTAVERGWVKGRDECWKDDQARRCIEEAYRTRLAELRIGEGARPAGVQEYRCNDDGQPLSAVFYDQFEPRVAVVSHGRDQAIVFAAAAADTLRHYARSGVRFDERADGAVVEFYGIKLQCRRL